MQHWSPGTHTSTFLGNAVNLAAGRAAITVMRRDRLWERSARLGTSLRDRLVSEIGGHPRVGDVRGLGLFIGIELVRDRASREPDPEGSAAVRRWAFERGVVLAGAGRYENVVKISPPLTIDDDQAVAATQVVIEAIGALG
jgi:4-aminobutyrate aminotransferase-like enzyme